MYDNRIYCTVNFSEVTTQIVSECIETNIDTLRHSIPGSGSDRVILKWDDNVIPSVIHAPSYYGPLDHTGILDLIVSGSDGSTWQEPEE